MTIFTLFLNGKKYPWLFHAFPRNLFATLTLLKLVKLALCDLVIKSANLTDINEHFTTNSLLIGQRRSKEIYHLWWLGKWAASCLKISD